MTTATYAGALAATKAKFVAEWVNGASPLSAIAYVNGKDVDKTAAGKPTEWVFFELVHAGTWAMIGGKRRSWDFLIKIHVFSPVGKGPETALALAVQAGEIFHNKVFYDTVQTGCFVRSGYDLRGQPRISEGDIMADNGNWFSTSCTIPAEYWQLDN